MGITLFANSDYANAVPEHAAPHTAVVLLGQNILYVTFISMFVNEVAKKIDKARHPHKDEVDI